MLQVEGACKSEAGCESVRGIEGIEGQGGGKQAASAKEVCWNVSGFYEAYACFVAEACRFAVTESIDSVRQHLKEDGSKQLTTNQQAHLATRDIFGLLAELKSVAGR